MALFSEKKKKKKKTCYVDYEKELWLYSDNFARLDVTLFEIN